MRLLLRWGDRETMACVTDVSESGMFVATRIAPPVGMTVRLELPSPRPHDARVRIEARVARTVTAGVGSLTGIGVEFLMIFSPHGTAELVAFLRQLGLEPAEPIPAETACAATMCLPSRRVVLEPVESCAPTLRDALLEPRRAPPVTEALVTEDVDGF